MVKRVIIQGGGVSPFRVSVAGVDAAGAQFNNLIFDGNQPPLRLYVTGFISIGCIDALNTASIFAVQGPPVISTPSGTFPILFASVRQPTTGAVNPGGVGNQNTPAFRTLNSFGLGASIGLIGGNNTVVGYNFNRDNASSGLFGSNLGVVNYAIMKNYL